MSVIKRFERNQAGRDFAVGDIHGHFTLLQKALDAACFDPAVDRLFSVGDLIDRGPECEDVEAWLAKPWFHPVRGNHDDYVCRYDTCEIGNWMRNGGSWFVGLPEVQQQCLAISFRELPIGIEIDTQNGLVGLVHADCVFDSWDELKRELDCASNQRRKLVMNTCMWSRTRIEQNDERPVHGLRALVVGHNPLRRPVVLGNVYHIDTMGWRPQDGGYFTLLNLETLEVA
ncbi:metallophosphoesterase [Pseudomonas aeruginosa]|uniref:metallophosphoesterase n=1 Tax=Pseudomonas aeruginosa TaxID=287 RepID=UPI000E320C7B|nr:metallophosphoesterase [Pseudomonas aeruginosa]MBV6005223.1 metallophosphoesterase [Pseudomonas aeruginosa]MBV6018469.1 metallophosphoesterase [Pseudomonas aeruginosa]MBV6030890.1 metallophosphoesterase [Pseudomonas aeruginosa]MBV6038439.1 metallophosphoesterase [Pseudomonas aeruginosa]MBV6043078.1 metallophosphoesterase [Pseudomonas aeruginosa]